MYKVELTKRELILLCNLVSQENKRVRAEFKLKNINFDKFKNLATEANINIRGLTNDR